MTDDAAKCRLIAKFEMPEMKWEHPRYYPHDLNATMRAARRLPNDSYLVVTSDGRAYIIVGKGQTTAPIQYDGDPARAAFEALAAYLENQTGAKR